MDVITHYLETLSTYLQPCPSHSLLSILCILLFCSKDKPSEILLPNSSITKLMPQSGMNKTPYSFFSIASLTFPLCASNLVSISKSFQTTTFHYPLLPSPPLTHYPHPGQGSRLRKSRQNRTEFPN